MQMLNYAAYKNGAPFKRELQEMHYTTGTKTADLLCDFLGINCPPPLSQYEEDEITEHSKAIKTKRARIDPSSGGRTKKRRKRKSTRR